MVLSGLGRETGSECWPQGGGLEPGWQTTTLREFSSLPRSPLLLGVKISYTLLGPLQTS